MKFKAEVSQVLSLVINSLYSMVQFPGWNTAQLAPRSIVAVGPTDVQQPLYCTSLPPAESLRQYRSTSTCVSQFTTNDTASLNLK